MVQLAIIIFFNDVHLDLYTLNEGLFCGASITITVRSINFLMSYIIIYATSFLMIIITSSTISGPSGHLRLPLVVTKTWDNLPCSLSARLNTCCELFSFLIFEPSLVFKMSQTFQNVSISLRCFSSSSPAPIWRKFFGKPLMINLL